MIAKKELAAAQLQAIDGFNRLASLYEKQGNMAKASYFYKRSLYILRTLHGNNHPDVIEAMEKLSAFYHRIADAASAKLIDRQLSLYRSERKKGLSHQILLTK